MSEPYARYPYGPYPVPGPPRKRRGRQALGFTVTAVIALAAGAGAETGLSDNSPSAHGAAAASRTALPASQLAARVGPGLVNVISTLGFQDAAAEGRAWR